MRVTNVGGSLGNGAALLIFLWTVHCWRRHVTQARTPGSDGTRKVRRMARYMARLSPAAVKRLVEQDPVLHVIIDLRSEERRQKDPLPQSEAFSKVVACLDQDTFGAALEDRAAWLAALPNGPPPPTTNHLLVFLSDTRESFEDAASTAAKNNYHRCMHVEQPCAAIPTASDPDLSYINRDAVAHLLELEAQRAAPEDFMFVDLRRHDERSLYGGISGSVHIPTELFVFAVQSGAQQFEADCHLPAPSKDQLLILQCRSNRRAGWAAQIAQEHGYERVLVYKQGSYGWRVDPAVKAYGSYEVGDDLPPAENVPEEQVDTAAAVEELRELGILHGSH